MFFFSNTNFSNQTNLASVRHLLHQGILLDFNHSSRKRSRLQIRLESIYKSKNKGQKKSV